MLSVIAAFRTVFATMLQVINIWDLNTYKLLRTVPVFEPIEAVVALSDDALEVTTQDTSTTAAAGTNATSTLVKVRLLLIALLLFIIRYIFVAAKACAIDLLFVL
jgi:hypothetical protein